MTSRPPPRTNRTRSNPSIKTSRNSISERHIWVKVIHHRKTIHVFWSQTCVLYRNEDRKVHCLIKQYLAAQNDKKRRRIQFSSPFLFFGGPGMLSRTSCELWDFLNTTSFSFTAVCILRTLD